MAGDLEGYGDASQLRISDADRHKVAELLREAAGEGRIDMEELDERLETTYAAKTYADLVPIVADLPGAAPVPRTSHAPAPYAANPTPAVAGSRHDTSLAIMSGQDRKGVWEVGATHTAVAIMGGVVIDLREAVFSSPEVVINASAFWGGVDVIVNARTRVSVEGIGIMGAFEQARDKVDPDVDAGSPLVRVRGAAIMAGVTVTRKPMPGEGRRRKRHQLPGH